MPAIIRLILTSTAVLTRAEVQEALLETMLAVAALALDTPERSAPGTRRACHESGNSSTTCAAICDPSSNRKTHSATLPSQSHPTGKSRRSAPRQ